MRNETNKTRTAYGDYDIHSTKTGWVVLNTITGHKVLIPYSKTYPASLDLSEYSIGGKSVGCPNWQYLIDNMAHRDNTLLRRGY